jgi:hypothetical protein
MAIIALKQEITVHKASDELDSWGNPIEAPPVKLKCRIDEGSYVTTTQSSLQTGRSVIATAKILLDKIVDIGYIDEIEYTNELNITMRAKPKKISIKRDASGKPMLTEVML